MGSAYSTRVGDKFLCIFTRDMDMDSYKPRNASLKILDAIAWIGCSWLRIWHYDGIF